MKIDRRFSAVFAFCIALLLTAAPALAQTRQDDASAKPPIQVYIMLGQSNMLGFGRVGPAEQVGSLEHYIKAQDKFGYLVDDQGQWVSRDDVRYVHVMQRGENMQVVANRPLTVDGRFGPELGFGHAVGDATEAPVLLLKACIGNRSLGWDLLPPGSERFTFDGRTYAGYGDDCPSWVEGQEKKAVNWYAGKQYDDDVANAKAVLADLETFYPDAAARGYEVAGFVWWQGHKDQNPAHAGRYEQNLVHLIHQLREDFAAPEAAFVIATIGFDGEALKGHALTIVNAQLAVDGDTGKYPEFAGNVASIDARPFWREREISPSGQGYHYHHNAETYMSVGEALGQAAVEMLEEDAE